MKFPNRFHWKSAKKHKVDVVFGAKFGQNCVQYCEKKKKKKKEKKETGILVRFFHILREVYI